MKMLRARRTGFALAAAVAIGLTSCASGAASDDDPYASGGVGTRDITVLVENLNTSDATLYMIWGAGNRVRLGRINSLSSAEFTTRWYYPDVRMEARFLAGRTYTTHSLPVSPGEILELKLPGNLD
jgi:hypothetical protein